MMLGMKSVLDTHTSSLSPYEKFSASASASEKEYKSGS